MKFAPLFRGKILSHVMSGANLYVIGVGISGAPKMCMLAFSDVFDLVTSRPLFSPLFLRGLAKHP